MSTINTNGLNVNYPVPGVNNNSQGFRDNFATIKTNLDTAATEITDLQNKVVLKQSLANSVLNNNMGNTLISNAATLGFRATTYNLGNALAGSVTVDLSLGDVQYGTIAANTSLSFANWGPSGTQSNVQLILNVSNANAVLSFPSQVVFSNNNYGVTTLENYANIANTPTVTFPNGVTQVDYRFSTIDCGSTIIVEPFNRPRITTQVQNRTPSPTGLPGDVSGTVAVDDEFIYVCTGNYNSTVVTTTAASISVGNIINMNGNVNSLSLDSPIIFSGSTYGNIQANTVYYIKTLSVTGATTADITISDIGWDGAAGSTFAVSPGVGNMSATSYNGTSIWKRSILSQTVGTTFENIEVTNGANILGELTVVGNSLMGNVSSLGSFTAIGNIRGGNLQSLGWLNVSSNANIGATLSVVGSTNVGSLGTNGSITAIGNIRGGNLVSTGALSVTGNSNVANVAVTGLITVSGNIQTSSTLVGANLSISGNANIGNLSSTTVFANVNSSGNSNLGNVIISGLTSSSGNITAPLFLGNFIGNWSNGNVAITGTNTGVVFVDNGNANSSTGFTFNKTNNSVAVLGQLSVFGNSNFGNISANGSIIGLGNIIADDTVVGSELVIYGNAEIGNVTANLFSGNIIGTGNSNLVNLGVTTLTSSGTLRSNSILTVVGNATVGNLTTGGVVNASGNVVGSNLITVGSISSSGTITAGTITYPNTAGSNGQYLMMGNSTHAIWSTISSGNGGVTSNAIQNGGSNVIVDLSGPVRISVSPNANILEIRQLGANLSGYLSVSGNANIGNIGTAGLITATGNIRGGNLTSPGNLSVSGNVISGAQISAAGNVIGGNFITAGYVSASTAFINDLGIGGQIISGGNITAPTFVGNLQGNISGSITTTGNILSTGSIISSGSTGIGYAAGTGSTVTIASISYLFPSNVVTINSITGKIIINSATFFIWEAVSEFVGKGLILRVNNDKIYENDVVIINKSSPNTSALSCTINSVNNGSFEILMFPTNSNGTAEYSNVVLNYAIIKGAAS